MTNEEMFTAIIARMDSMEYGLNRKIDGLETRMDKMESGLNGRMDGLETRMDGLETRMDGLETRMDGLETRIGGLEIRVDGLGNRIDKMKSDNDMEFQAVRMEMDVANKSLKKDISVLNDKIDRLMFTKDVDGYEKMKIQVEALTQGYQELKVKIG